MGSGPQVEDGFTRLANELIDALCKAQLSAIEWRIVMAIVRRTYGYNVKAAPISNGYLSKATGIDRSNVIRSLNRLVEARVVSRVTLGKQNTLAILKDYRKWKLSKPSVTGDTTASVMGDTQKRQRQRQKTKPIRRASTRRAPSPEAVKAAGLLADLIALNNEDLKAISNGNREKSISQWANDLDLMNRKDGRTWEQIEYLVRFSQQDDFWKANILSGKKLRKQQDQLIAKIRAKRTGRSQSLGETMARAMELLGGDDGQNAGRGTGGRNVRLLPSGGEAGS